MESGLYCQIGTIDEGLSDSEFSNRLLELELLDVPTLDEPFARKSRKFLDQHCFGQTASGFTTLKVRLSNIAGVRFESIN